MWKVALGLLVFAFFLSTVVMAHGVMTGIAVPYPDPTPEQAAHVKYHMAISETLFLVAGSAWSVAVGFVAICSARRAIRRGRD